MLGNGGEALIERYREITHGRFCFAQLCEQRPARRVCQRGKGSAEDIGAHRVLNRSVEHSFRSGQVGLIVGKRPQGRTLAAITGEPTTGQATVARI